MFLIKVLKFYWSQHLILRKPCVYKICVLVSLFKTCFQKNQAVIFYYKMLVPGIRVKLTLVLLILHLF